MPDNQILIVANQLKDMLGDPNLVIVDCRFNLNDPAAGQHAYTQQHVPGAVFLDLDKDLAGPVGATTGRHPLPAVERIVEKLGASGICNSSRIVVYDGGNGAYAARAWWILRWLGHDAVQVLDGGFAEWCRQGLPVDSVAVSRSPATYIAKLRSNLVLTTREIESNLHEIGALRLVDVRDDRRFRGEIEPIDQVAGHVPGAVNLPFTRFVHEDGTWRTLADRSTLLEAVLGTDRETAWSLMCGSGVTACHLAISGIEAGFREPRIYVGSWSEWIRDPDRPVGLGEA